MIKLIQKEAHIHVYVYFIYLCTIEVCLALVFFGEK